jgi:hypothetical protein
MTRQEALHILEFGLTVYDALFVAYLRRASLLLSEDQRFSWQQRESAWKDWLTAFSTFFDESLRYRLNESIMTSMAVAIALMPSRYPEASLIGFKYLEDALLEAGRKTPRKREKAERPRRLTEIVSRKPMWVDRNGSLHQPTNEADMPSAYQSEWGVAFPSILADAVLPLVRAVMPVAHWSGGGLTVVVVVPGD